MIESRYDELVAFSEECESLDLGLMLHSSSGDDEPKTLRSSSR